MTPGPETPAPTFDARKGGDFLTVSVDDDLFAIPIELVHEVLDPPPVTRVPNAPAFAPGLVNVRGNILPLVDLRRRFGMDAAADTEHSRVIVSRVGAGPEGFLVAVKADAVHEVQFFAPDAVEPLPENGTRWPAEYLAGVVRHEGRFVILVDLCRILRPEEAVLPH